MAPHLVHALDTDQAKTLGLGLIILVVVVGVVIALVVKAIIGKLIAIVVGVVLVAGVWSQHSTIEHDAKKCDATFFGVHLKPGNDTLKKKCEELSNR